MLMPSLQAVTWGKGWHAIDNLCVFVCTYVLLDENSLSVLALLLRLDSDFPLDLIRS